MQRTGMQHSQNLRAGMRVSTLLEFDSKYKKKKFENKIEMDTFALFDECVCNITSLKYAIFLIYNSALNISDI